MRTFKLASFAKQAKKAGLTDEALCKAIAQVHLGQAVDLGGGVYKKRLQNNALRSLILAKGGKHWFYQYLFAKNAQDNISSEELADLKHLAKAYAELSQAQLNQLIHHGDLQEICKDDSQA